MCRESFGGWHALQGRGRKALRVDHALHFVQGVPPSRESFAAGLQHGSVKQPLKDAQIRVLLACASTIFRAFCISSSSAPAETHPVIRRSVPDAGTISDTVGVPLIRKPAAVFRSLLISTSIQTNCSERLTTFSSRKASRANVRQGGHPCWVKNTSAGFD